MLFVAALEKITADFRDLDEVQRSTALGTAETMRQSQVKNLLLPGLILKDLIHIPTCAALSFELLTQHDGNKHFTGFMELQHMLLKVGKIRCQIVKGLIYVSVHICTFTQSAAHWAMLLSHPVLKINTQQEA